jgi:AcrR family transcriptional regulator
MKKQPTTRPGGRSGRVKADVFDAVEALMAKNPHATPSMGEIAARAGVNPTSLYRRWGDAGVLAVEVAIERVMRDFPMPNTGTLRGDLLGWALNVARSLSGKKDLALLRVLAATTQTGEEVYQKRVTAVARRGQELNVVLERAQARGEAVPTMPEVLEIVLAPIYFRALFFGAMREEDDVARLVDRALALAPKQNKRAANAASRSGARGRRTTAGPPRRN